MKCHYEVLGLETNCTSDDLKKAYRKLALEWHPDKNLHRLEESKENFQLIQQAYEILSDPQERAWYDRHKDDILRGGAEEAYKDNCLDVYQYYNTSCFKGYNDDEKGFYTVYKQVFEKITAEDKPFMDDDEDMEVPQFGFSYSSYEEVVHNFYAYWQSYCTAKTFSWVDKYDLTEARRSGAGRQVIRAMEKENKKLRDQHKKMRNEEVRELVAFVRKRDKRIQAHKKRMEEVKAEKAKKAEELRRKQLKERNKEFENYTETEWSSMSQFENHFTELESALDATFGDNTGDIDDNDAEDDELGDLYCVACEKDFRSQKAFINHENSKKHKENVALLKELMEEEEAMAVSENVEENSVKEDDDSVECDEEEKVSSEALLGELIKSSTKSKKKKKKNKNLTPNNDMDEADTEEVELKMNDVQISGETGSLDPDEISIREDVVECDEEESISSEALLGELIKSSTKSKKKKKKNKNLTPSNTINEADVTGVESKMNNVQISKENDSVDPDEISSSIKQNISSEADQQVELAQSDLLEDSSKVELVSSSISKETSCEKSKSSSKIDSAKKKGKKDKTPKNEKNTCDNNEDSAEKPNTLCSTCNNNFSSRNKLFEHLKQTGHAAYKNETVSSSSGKKQRRKKL